MGGSRDSVEWVIEDVGHDGTTITAGLSEQFHDDVMSSIAQQWWDTLLATAEDARRAEWIDAAQFYDDRTALLVEMIHALRSDHGPIGEGAAFYAAPDALAELRGDCVAPPSLSEPAEGDPPQVTLFGTTYPVYGTPCLPSGTVVLTPLGYDEPPVPATTPTAIATNAGPATAIRCTITAPGELSIERNVSPPERD